MSALRLLAVHAHPDDETLFTGGTIAQYSRRGVKVSLVTCTGGERGAGGAGAQRIIELERACGVLGVAELFLLGYIDSGNGTNVAWNDSDAFVNQNEDEVVGRLVDVIQRVRPHVVVTYDERGIYGHVDHIRAHRLTVLAVAAAATASKLYFSVLPRSLVQTWMPILEIVDSDLPADRCCPDAILDRWGTDDDAVSAAIDVRRTTGVVREALAAYATQRSVLTPFLTQPALFPPCVEHYTCHPQGRFTVRRDRDLFQDGVGG